MQCKVVFFFSFSNKILKINRCFLRSNAECQFCYQRPGISINTENSGKQVHLCFPSIYNLQTEVFVLFVCNSAMSLFLEELLLNVDKASNPYLGAIKEVGNNALERKAENVLTYNCNEVYVVCSVYMLVLPTTTLTVRPV